MTIMGTPVSGGVANSRTIPVLLSGIIGGPFVGTLSGVIAGLHRMFLFEGGDLTAFSCGVSTIIAGIMGGYAKKKSPKRYYKGFLIGIIVEVIQIGIILVLATPFDQALALVKIIILPRTFLNAFGVGMFLYFVQQIYDENDNASAKMAHYDAVAITDTSMILSHIGAGEDHHRPGGLIWTQKTKETLQTETIQEALNFKDVSCSK